MECVLGVAGPLIAVSGEALAKSASATAKVFGKITHVLHLAETGLEYALIATDASLFFYGIYEMVEEKEIELMKSSLQAKTTEAVSKVSQTMSNIRSGHAWSLSLLSDGLTTEVAQMQVANTNDVLSFYEKSDDNNTTVNFNINNKREERYKEIEKSRKIQSIVQKCIAGACCVAGAAIAIASMVVTAGTSAAAVLAVAAPIVTVVGGANAVIEGATDYQNNAVVVSQCFNVGEIKVDKVDKVGGVLGHAQQFCEITDCVNAGPFNGKATTKTGGVVGRADSRSVIKNCLNVGKNWNYVIYSTGDAVTTSNLYYYDPYLEIPSGELPPSGFFGKYLTLDKLYKEDTYKEWAFNGDFARWQVKDSKGYFPVPYHSEMEETIKQ